MYKHLKSENIVSGMIILSARIKERFPEAGLKKVADEVVKVAEQTHSRVVALQRPIWGLRITVFAGTAVIVVAFVWAALNLNITNDVFEFAQFVTVLEAGLNVFIVVGGSLLFLVTVETRIKRARTLKALQELRSLAHVIDMHQLNKDPGKFIKERSTKSSPALSLSPFEVGRYLDYCSEMLSHIGKLAAIYVQDFDDAVALAAVNEVENLTAGLSRKIWQKITVLTSVQS